MSSLNFTLYSYSVCVCCVVYAQARVQRCRGQKRPCGTPFYHFPSLSLETMFPTEPGSRLTANKTQQFSCFLTSQIWGCRQGEPHLAFHVGDGIPTLVFMLFSKHPQSLAHLPDSLNWEFYEPTIFGIASSLCLQKKKTHFWIPFTNSLLNRATRGDLQLVLADINCPGPPFIISP